MSLGSEQFLETNGAREESFRIPSSPSDASALESDPIEDLTVDDSGPGDDIIVGGVSPPQKQNSLMSLLSGTQNAKKRKYTKKPKKDPVPEPPRSPEQACSLVSDSDSVEVADVSFDASQFERDAAKRQAIAILEEKMFSAGKSVSLRDFLQNKPAPKMAVKGVSREPKKVEILPETPVSQPEVISVDDEIEGLGSSSDIEILFPASKSVSARNLFDSFAPKRAKKSNGEWSLKVQLKVSPERLKSVNQSANPVRPKGNAAAGTSMLSMLMPRKPSMKVTLKLPPQALQEAAKAMDPLVTKGSGNSSGKNARVFFAMMMKTATDNAFPKLTAIQRLKGLQPPPVERGSMHVVPENDRIAPGPMMFTHRRRLRPPKDEHLGSMAELEPDSSVCAGSTVGARKLSFIPSNRMPSEETVETNAPLAFSSTPHSKLYHRFVSNPHHTGKHQNWPQKFQPKDIESLLIESESREFLTKWMSNAFSILETQSTKTPRNVKIRELQKKQRRREIAQSKFIVDDDEEEEESDTDEDVFVPILVIQGDSGSGKSACIYAAMAAMDGYVHEINTGQARSRKDIHSSLKEFCTTQIIHQNHDERRFQKGLVLFEDCDILFEQDRTFWTTVQEVINFSRRPIVVTVKDISAVPRNILDLAEEQSSVLKMETAPKDDVRQYLWLCAYSENLNFSQEVLDGVLRDCETGSGFDLRKALMATQWLGRMKPSASGLCDVSYESSIEENTKPTDDFKTAVRKLDAISAADVIESNTHSSILHDVQMNELVDIYIIDDSLHLKQRTLPHELNTGNSIRELLDHSTESDTGSTAAYNDIRNKVLTFILSRAKKLPKFIQELYGTRVQTRSRSGEIFAEERPETQGLPETSICYSLSRSAFMLDLTPMAQYWAAFQKSIMALDADGQARGESTSLVSFLGWRRFYEGVDDVLDTRSIRR